MNEWVLAGIVAVGTILLMGGGSWVIGSLTHKKDNTKT